MNENAKDTLVQAASLAELAARAAAVSLRQTNDPAAWVLGDAAYWAARAAAQALNDLATEGPAAEILSAAADRANEAADELVSIAEATGHTILR